MTTNPTQSSAPTPDQPIVVEDRFRTVVDDIATDAREAKALRDGLDREINAELAADRSDEERQADLEHELQQIHARRAARADKLTGRRAARQAAAADVARLESDVRRGLAAIEHLNRYRDAEPLPADEAVRAAGLPAPAAALGTPGQNGARL